ncbi:exodeoxyribonuclease VII small subunit [Glaciecola nitratireducens FR1064]|uniref:Exodeoxyribonuclease 7 small subunit n=2 Tax=Brumicola TaxID=3160924 RepID=G4QG78_GLANF|nr:exodeoxyribonuclease VII small subunit [Glaciecola nitratireducens FR1064]
MVLRKHLPEKLKSMTEQKTSFEAAMQELEEIVVEMEKGDIPLEDSLKKFERGIQLARQSQQQLKAAEQKVQILMQSNGTETLADFESDEL